MEMGFAKQISTVRNYTPNLSYLLMRSVFALFPTSNCLPDSLSCAGVGVKQSGNRLFQLNN
ncbi:hypothetical protein F6P84_10540 [Streptococcus suis]|nr:hypothetical protein SSUST3_0636 [Streptococcus suis ST3]AER16872.1 hypothetical protein SSUD9_0641 [Streptococcus suis D9]AUW26394.1 hypothetical protein CR542_07820 [Streptococcus suis]MBL1133439.1 hypothetical protein [Streptococcus suis]MBL1157972.1 hypothetical protein [Streptococcus suis]